MSNEKQIGLGLMMYLQDYDERTPRYNDWMHSIQPYVKSGQVFVCPSAEKPLPSSADGCDPTYANTNANFWGSYGMNGKYFSNVSIASINKVSETVFLAESSGKTRVRYVYAPHYWNNNYNSQCGDSTTTFTAGDGIARWHFGGNNILFADGHAKWLKIDQLGDYNGDGHIDDGWFCADKSACPGL